MAMEVSEINLGHKAAYVRSSLTAEIGLHIVRIVPGADVNKILISVWRTTY